MNILTDEEIIFIENTTASRRYNDHARAIEAAIMSKLAEQDVEPVGEVTHRAFGYVKWASERPEIGTKLYTETQYIAAQQRTAEACLSLAESRHANGNYRFTHRDEFAEALRNEEWREYL